MWGFGRIWVNTLLLVISCLFITIGCVTLFYFQTIYDNMIASAMSFNANSQSYQAWKRTEIPLQMDIYIFNWTNPNDIRNSSIKPQLEQVGPYRFREIREKVNISWHPDGQMISYRNRMWYYFDQESSARPLSDVVTLLNILPLTIAYKSRFGGYFSKRTISYSLSSLSSLYVTKTVREILFDGYEESILRILNSLPLIRVTDKFGFFYGRNGTISDDGTYTMWTANDEHFGEIRFWNGKNHSHLYEKQCGNVEGSAGEFYPMNSNRDTLKLFFAEICKHSSFEYEQDVVVKGVSGYKYTGKDIFDNGTIRLQNKCFCSGKCVPTGILNASECRQGSPTFLSLPHFYGADPVLVNQVNGLRPNKSLHDFYIVLEPKTSVVIDITARLQVNVLLQPIPYISLYENVPTIFMPIFYIEEAVTINDDLASKLTLLQNMPDISVIVAGIAIIIGIFAIVWFLINVISSTRSDTSLDSKMSQSDLPTEVVPLRQ